MIRSTALGTSLRLDLLHARISQGLTQAKLAERMGTTQSAISDLESGTYDPRLHTLVRWAHALGMTMTITLISKPED